MTDKAKFVVTVRGELEKVQKTIAMYKKMTHPIAPDNAIGPCIANGCHQQQEYQ